MSILGFTQGRTGWLVALDAVQANLGQWVARTFGAKLRIDCQERVARLLEEVIELAQAEGFPAERINALIAHVYSKPVGDARREAGAVGVTWLAYCDALAVSSAGVLEEELARIYAIPREVWEQRHAAKTAKGLAANAEVEVVVGIDVGRGESQTAIVERHPDGTIRVADLPLRSGKP